MKIFCDDRFYETGNFLFSYVIKTVF